MPVAGATSRLYHAPQRLAASTALVLAAIAAPPSFAAAPAHVGGSRETGAAAGIDGIVFRGRLRAHVSVGRPDVRLDEARPGDVAISRLATTLTFARVPAGGSRVPTIVVRVARLRGIATSGDVDLVVDDRSDRPVFLDLAGAGAVRVRGAVPLARTTTSGTVAADFSELRALAIRVHARERSRASFAGYEHLTIVAVDDATVIYRGPSPDRVTRRGRATIRGVTSRAPIFRRPERR